MEIRFSDLFKRKSKKSAAVPADEASPAAGAPPPPVQPPQASQVPPADAPTPAAQYPAAPTASAPSTSPVGSEQPTGGASEPSNVPPSVIDAGAVSPGVAPSAPGPAPARTSGSEPSAELPAAASAAALESASAPRAEQPVPEPNQPAGSQTPDHAATTAVSSEEQEASPWKRELHAADLLKKMGWSGGSNPPSGKASEQRTPRPEAPQPASPQPDSPAQGDEGSSLWKRELRAGDLFRRREPAPPVPGDVFSDGGSEPVSFWKKELSLSDLLRTSDDSPGTATLPPPEQGAEATPATEGKKDKKRKAHGLPKFDLKPGRSSLGKKRGSKPGPATTPLAVPLMRAVNLLPPDLVATKTRRFGPAEIGVAVAAVVVIAGLAVAFMSASGRTTEAQDQVIALEQQQAQLQQAATEAAAGAGLQADPLLGEELGRATALSDALDSRTAWDRVLRQVTLVMPPDMWLRGLSGTSTTSDIAVSAGSGAELASTLTLTGFVLTRDRVAQLLSRMETIPELSNVQLLAATVTELNSEEVVEFSITATLKEVVGGPPAATPIGVTP